MATTTKSPLKSRTQRAYRRGNSDHYADLARKSVDSRIKRHVEVEILRDPERVTSVPSRKRESDAGYDLATAERVALQPGRSVVVGTGIKINCPPGYFFEVRGRSSLTGRGVEVADAIIDATYTGEVKVRITNHGSELLALKVGDRVAQLIFLPQIYVTFRAVEAFKLADGARGETGFGSTGV